MSRNEKNEYELPSHSTSIVYSKPGKIINNSISEYNHESETITLKQGMQEVYDYVLINSKGWKYLTSWYGSDHPVYVTVKHY